MVKARGDWQQRLRRWCDFMHGGDCGTGDLPALASIRMTSPGGIAECAHMTREVRVHASGGRPCAASGGANGPYATCRGRTCGCIV